MSNTGYRLISSFTLEYNADYVTPKDNSVPDNPNDWSDDLKFAAETGSVDRMQELLAFEAIRENDRPCYPRLQVAILEARAWLEEAIEYERINGTGSRTVTTHPYFRTLAAAKYGYGAYYDLLETTDSMENSKLIEDRDLSPCS